MIVPTLEQVGLDILETDNNKNSTNEVKENNKKVFYEVGCKVFEINQIYKK
jgi:hypothetical protein